MNQTHGANDNGRPLYLLPGVPETLVRRCFEKGNGSEIESGTIFSPESSSALVANTIGWFLERAQLLPPLPGLEECWFDIRSLDFERCIRVPRLGRRHPILSAVVETGTHIIGVESRRCEPFRGHRKPKLSAAFDRDVWGSQMGPYLELRDQLRSGAVRYRYLDAAQLVKCALALSVESRRTGKLPILYYLFDEPHGVAGRRIPLESWVDHRLEIYDFIERVAGADVQFFWSDYSAWVGEWDEREEPVRRHGERVLRYLALLEAT